MPTPTSGCADCWLLPSTGSIGSEKDCSFSIRESASTTRARTLGRSVAFGSGNGGDRASRVGLRTGHGGKSPWRGRRLRRGTLILDRDCRQQAIRRLPGPDDDAVALLITERDIDSGRTAILGQLGLTPRRSEVLDLAAGGATNAEVAVAVRSLKVQVSRSVPMSGVIDITAGSRRYGEPSDRSRSMRSGRWSRLLGTRSLSPRPFCCSALGHRWAR